ncbi:MAG: DUF3616 domain-containing protein [Planctomycetota bacterium]
MTAYRFLIFLLLAAGFSVSGGDSSFGDVNSSEVESVLLFKKEIEKVGEYSINPKQVYGKNDISAIACIRQGHCLIGADEGIYAQLCEISKDDEIIIVDTVRLLPGEGGSEIDIEGATVIGDTYYLTGSHGLAKNSGEYQDSRHYCFRFKVDEQSGKKAGDVEVSSLRYVIESEPVIKPYYKKILQRKGVNIEGLASKDGQLFFGFRAPNITGRAFVVEIEPEELFDEKEEKAYKLHSLELGDGLGIREIAAVEEGFLIIAGNSGSEPGNDEKADMQTEVQDWEPGRGFNLFFWDGGTEVQKKGEIPRDDEGYKAEGMMVLKENGSAIDVLIMYDGPAGGSPTIYRIFKESD